MAIEVCTQFPGGPGGTQSTKIHAVDREINSGRTLCGRVYLGTEPWRDPAEIDCQLCLQRVPVEPLQDGGERKAMARCIASLRFPNTRREHERIWRAARQYSAEHPHQDVERLRAAHEANVRDSQSFIDRAAAPSPPVAKRIHERSVDALASSPDRGEAPE